MRSIPAPAGEPFVETGKADRPWVYPRACGGTFRVVGSKSFMTGLSPRLRGNRILATPNMRLIGSIPAPAGEPRLHPARRDRGLVYPRACGGTSLTCDGCWGWLGLSPRLRGNRVVADAVHHAVGSIPAPAGEPPLLMSG